MRHQLPREKTLHRTEVEVEVGDDRPYFISKLVGKCTPVARTGGGIGYQWNWRHGEGPGAELQNCPLVYGSMRERKTRKIWIWIIPRDSLLMAASLWRGSCSRETVIGPTSPWLSFVAREKKRNSSPRCRHSCHQLRALPPRRYDCHQLPM